MVESEERVFYEREWGFFFFSIFYNPFTELVKYQSMK